MFPFLRIFSEQPASPEAERNRRLALLRTQVVREMRERGWTRLGVMPLTEGAGATTVALELTWAILRQPGVRVSLVDLDFANPAIARQLEIPGCGPVTDAVVTPDRRIGHLAATIPEQPALQILAPTNPEPYPAELLQSPSFQAALTDMLQEQSCDYVILDLAPLVGTDIGLSALPLVDAILLVADGTNNQLRDMKLAERYLADEAPLMGVVLNKAEK